MKENHSILRTLRFFIVTTLLGLFGLNGINCTQSGEVEVPLGETALAKKFIYSPENNWVKVKGNHYVTAAIRGDGTLWVWGLNDYGQLGDETTLQKLSPVQVGSDTNWADVDAGYAHVVALKTDGTLWTWGLNSKGQLGLGDTQNRPLPVMVPGTGYTSVSAGIHHTVVMQGDKLYVTGSNTFGQLGLGDNTNRTSLVLVGNGFTQAVAGENFTLALTTGKTLVSTGYNIGGQLGNGTATDLNTFQPAAAGFANIVQIDAGKNHAAFRTSVNKVYAWGANNRGQLCNQTYTESTVPVLVGAYNSFSVGGVHTLLLNNNQALYTCGFNHWGQLGIGSNTSSNTPTLVMNQVASVNGSTRGSAAIRTDGSLWLWGYGEYGTNGDGTTIDRRKPVLAGSNFNSFSAGWDFAVYIENDGSLWAWGQNDLGQLGSSEYPWIAAPVLISAEKDWAGVAAGAQFAVALKTDGTMWSWGDNTYSQTGNGVGGSTIRQIGTDSDWLSVSSGNYHTIARKRDGTIWTWGDGNLGQLCQGATTTSPAPVQIGVGFSWKEATAGGQRTYAIRSDGRLYECGRSIVNGLDWPDLHLFDYSLDWATVNLSSYSHALAIKLDGTLWGWGANSANQIVPGSTIQINAPVQIGTDTDWMSAVSSYNASLALKNDGALWAWGLAYNRYGNSQTEPYDTPTPTGANYLKIFPNSSSSSGLDKYNQYWHWDSTYRGVVLQDYNLIYRQRVQNPTLSYSAGGYGQEGGHTMYKEYVSGYNLFGQLGLGTTTDIWTTSWSGLELWQSVQAGGRHSVAIDHNGMLWSWGGNSYGQLGNAIFSEKHTTPDLVNFDTDWRYIGSMYENTFAIKENGTLWAWGRNHAGQLGIGNTQDQNTPVQVGTDKDWKMVSSGNCFTVALKTDGTLWSWGCNGNGQLGHGAISFPVLTPQQVGVDSDWTQVSAGYAHTLALKTDGSLWAWGLNASGQLGDNTTDLKSSPLQIGVGVRWVMVAAGGQHSLAIQADSSLWSWGRNHKGQLGDGTTTNRLAPVYVATNYVSVEAGMHHSMGRKRRLYLQPYDWTMDTYVWGDNSTGQLGNGTTTNSLVPIIFR